MQQYVSPAFATRLLYYWAGAHAEQLVKGERYELVQPTYAICWLNETLFDDAFYHHRFRVHDDKHGTFLCKDLEIHVLEVNKFNVPVEEVKTPLERWLSFFKQGAALSLATLPATLDVPPIRRAMEVLVQISQTERERQWAMERRRAERDAAFLAETAKVALENLQAAKEEAKEEARLAQQKGLAKGKRIGRILRQQLLLGQPETPEEELEQQEDEDLIRLEQTLTNQLNARKQGNGASPTDKA